MLYVFTNSHILLEILQFLRGFFDAATPQQKWGFCPFVQIRKVVGKSHFFSGQSPICWPRFFMFEREWRRNPPRASPRLETTATKCLFCADRKHQHTSLNRSSCWICSLPVVIR